MMLVCTNGSISTIYVLEETLINIK